jgi:hypothetical protein
MRRRSKAKEMARGLAQLKKWCDGKDRLALSLKWQFFHLTFVGHLSLESGEVGSYVFVSPDPTIIISDIFPLASDIEVKEENGRATVSMNRKEGQISITEIDTLADLLAAMPSMSKLVQ